MNGHGFRTIGQKMSGQAFACVRDFKNQHAGNFDEYETFAKKFPSLIHACGLAQAIAFAQAKDERVYLSHLASVLKQVESTVTGQEDLARLSRDASLRDYLRLSRNTLTAAGWIKRYVEALKEKKD